MNDTSSEIEAMVAARFVAMTPSERVRIAVQMCRTARHIVESSLSRDLSEMEGKRELCARLYGDLALVAFPRVEGR